MTGDAALSSLSRPTALFYGHAKKLFFKKSGLLANLALTAAVNPCSSTYQCCYSETTMIRCRNKGIDDLGALRI